MKKIIFILITITCFINARSQSWLLTGNGGLDSKIHFIGTKDDSVLTFRIRNNFAGIIDSSNKVTSFGYAAGKKPTVYYAGFSNAGFGYKALATNYGGYGNAGIGAEALFLNGSGEGNTGTGTNTLRNNISAHFNTATGSNALYNHIAGNANTATGYQALLSNNSGAGNTAFGSGSLIANTTGSLNTGIGKSALAMATAGNENTASGYLSSYYMGTGSWNTAEGSYSLYMIGSAGNYNTAIGAISIYNCGNTQFNTGLGCSAGSSYSIAGSNVFLGALTQTNANNYYNAIAIGQATTCTNSNQVRIGNSNTTSIGGYAGWTNISDGRFKKDIQTNVPGVEFIMKLRPVTYHLDITGISKKLEEKTGGDDHAITAIAAKERILYSGFIAQEVEAAAKEVGYDFSGVDKPGNDKDLYGLRYEEFVTPLVKAVQEQQEKIKKMNEQIALLKKQQHLLEELLKADSALTVK